MTVKIKIFLGVLAVFAFLTVFTFSKSLITSGESVITSANLSKATQLEVETDSDNDGLLNSEESIWNTDFQDSDSDDDGFLDGEEVASGHDPIKKGPDDLLVLNNVTESTAELIVSGLMEGSLKPSNPDYIRSVNLVVDEILISSDISTFPGRIDPKIVPFTKESGEKYTKETLGLVKKFIENEGERQKRMLDLLDQTSLFGQKSPESDDSLTNYLTSEVRGMREQISKIESSDIPDRFSESHQRILTQFKKLERGYTALIDFKDDPLRAMMVLVGNFDILVDYLPREFESLVNNLENNNVQQ